MTTSAYSPYRSEAARDFCFAYLDSQAARDWPVASREKTVPTTYGGTFVRISGPASAPPLVLLPGAAATSLMWASNIQALSAEYQTFAVDQIGDFGRSSHTRPFRRFSDLLAWLNELCDGLELGDGISLAGMSFGGALAAEYALHFPGRLNKVVLLAPGATVLRIRTEFIVRLILAAMASRRWLPSIMHWMFADMARKDPRWIDETLNQLFTNMWSLERKIPNPRVWTDAEWGNLRVPALFLVGEHETIYSAEKAVRRLRRVARQVTAEIVPGAGHDLPFVQAAIVNQRIVEFLKQEPLASKMSAAGGR
ncbi:MAG TPA: alpha/beta hydrolase [Bryobacteraceae bacterium]|nr:alpha/beta hydrolase [Bryobacteraceae bacterium]